jgi:hypothetical protein
MFAAMNQIGVKFNRKKGPLSIKPIFQEKTTLIHSKNKINVHNKQPPIPS